MASNQASSIFSKCEYLSLKLQNNCTLLANQIKSNSTVTPTISSKRQILFDQSHDSYFAAFKASSIIIFLSMRP